jgi:serine/threonine-protein kinase
MPFLEGGTLRDRMQAPVPLAKAAAWIGQLAGALDAAHEAGVLHRDVKPANVLLGKGERLFLADFGIAKMLESAKGLTATGMVVGTPLYMAPEQAQGKPASPATDRYALAVISFELLAGRPPFEGESPLSLMHQHVTSPAPVLSARVSGLPAGLDAVFSRALAKDPAERHPTSSAFAAAVAAFTPTGIAGAVPSTAAGSTPIGSTAPTVLRPDRPRPVATPALGLTSDQTVLTGPGRGRKTLLRGLAAALVLAAAAGGLFLLRKRDDTGTSAKGTAERATPGLAATPEDPSKARGQGALTSPVSTPSAPAPLLPDSLFKKSPVVSPSADAEATKIAELEARLRKAEKELASGSRAAARPAPESPPPPAQAVSEPQDDIPARSAAAKLLQPAVDRLDPQRRAARRLTKEDFEVSLAAAQSALKEDPKGVEARYLLIYASGGLAYVARNDEAASQALVEAFAHVKRLTRREVRPLAVLLRAPDGTIVPPKGWALALAYGDARGEADRLLAEALARKPDDPKALVGRAKLRRLEGRMSEFVADLKLAAAANPPPQILQGILDLLRSACRSGFAEACREAKSLGSQPPAPRRK